jgi:hypothetical protein
MSGSIGRQTIHQLSQLDDNGVWDSGQVSMLEELQHGASGPVLVERGLFAPKNI